MLPFGIAPTSQMRTVPSSDAVTTRLLSGLKAAETTGLAWPLRMAISRHVVASRMRAVLFSDAMTTRVPSGLKAEGSIDP